MKILNMYLHIFYQLFWYICNKALFSTNIADQKIASSTVTIHNIFSCKNDHILLRLSFITSLEVVFSVVINLYMDCLGNLCLFLGNCMVGFRRL